MRDVTSRPLPRIRILRNDSYERRALMHALMLELDFPFLAYEGSFSASASGALGL